jgi:capsular polysaccharide biosynthesis protein
MSVQAPEKPLELAPALQPREPVGVWDAVRASPLLVLISIILLVGAGVAVGLTRDPNYTAQTRLGVFHVDVSAFSGSSSAAESLADSYSRAIDANQVVRPVAARFHRSPKDVRARLSAAPIPDSPVLRVVALAGSQRQAVALANAASNALLGYVAGLNPSERDAARLFRRLRAAESRFNALLAAEDRRKGAVEDRLKAAAAANPEPTTVQPTTVQPTTVQPSTVQPSTVQPTQKERLALARARAAAAAAHDRVTALRTAYNESVGSATSTQTLSVLVRATDAQSDRWPRLELLAFVGLAIGMAIGVALAMARAARRRRNLAPV